MLLSAHNAFVGRRSELDGLLRAVRDGERLITLVGPAGVGKTRLALELERGLRQEKRAVFFCALEEARTAPEAWGALSRSLGVLGGADDRAIRVARALAAQASPVLIMDNLEQLVDAIVGPLDSLLRAAPNLTVIATSREVLRLAPERVVEVQPLSAALATTLFLARAQERGCSGAQAQAPVVQKIVERLDGLPLAIELAAARARILAPQEILDRMERRFELLKGGFRGAPERQRALLAAFDWSWNMLSKTERVAMARCAVFEGAFDASSAESLLGEPDGLDLLQSLVDKSLVQVGEEAGWFSMLESVRAYGREKLERMELLASARRQHALHFAERAAQERAALLGKQGPQALANLVRMLPNLISAARFSTEASQLHRAALQLLEGLEDALRSHGDPQARLTIARATVKGSSGPTRANVILARALRDAGDPQASLQTLDAIGAVRQPELGAEVALERARTLIQLGRLTESEAALVSALQDCADPLLESSLHLELGRLRTSQGDRAPARRHYELALGGFRRAGSVWHEREALPPLGFLQLDAAQTAEARVTYEAALELARAFQDRDTEARTLGYLGSVARREGAVEEAVRRYLEAIEKLRAQGNQRFEGVFWMDLGILWLERQRPERACEPLERALALERATQERRGEAITRGYLAAITANEPEVARAHLTRARAILDEGEHLVARFLALMAMHVQVAEGQTDEAIEALQDEDRAAPDHVHYARRSLRRAVDARLGRSEALLIAGDGTWFRAAGQAPVDLSRRIQPARLLSAMLKAWLDGDGMLSIEALFARGWPDEQASAAAIKNRVRVAIAALRSSGLQDVVRTVAGGYGLAPPGEVIRSPHPCPSDSDPSCP